MRGVPTCREVTQLVASGELESTRLVQRLKVRLHLFMCKHCSNYASQIRSIGERARMVFRSGGEDAGTADRLEKSILKGIQEGESSEAGEPS